MATATLISVDEYIGSVPRPDADYIDGEIRERNAGERSHGRIQGLIFAWLLAREAQFGIAALVEVRLRVGERRYRIPDVMAVSATAPHEEVVETAPVLCAEVLSPGDSLEAIWERTQDYFSIGVPVCWIVAPQAAGIPKGWIATPAGLVEAADGVLRAGDIELPLASIKSGR